MIVSILFSIVIFEITTLEFGSRLERFERNLQIIPGAMSQQPMSILRSNEIDTAAGNIITGLVAINILVLVIGGAVSYIFARRTLKPIQEAHEAQSRFNSDASHELRTPLAAMKTEIEVALRDTSITKKDLENVMQSTLEEVDKLTNLSQMLLNLSRLDHHKLKSTSINLTKITHEVIKLYKPSVNRIKVTSNNKAIALGDEPAIRELVAILIDNALKYSPTDSLIQIAIDRLESHVSFTITNTGEGINESKLPYVFDRFYRADSSRTHRIGYGLGLSIAKKIVELSHGELHVTSTPGQSTTFTAFLPLSIKRTHQKENITTK